MEYQHVVHPRSLEAGVFLPKSSVAVGSYDGAARASDAPLFFMSGIHSGVSPPPSHALERGGVTISGGARAHTMPRCHLDCQFMLHPPHHFFSTASRQFGILMAVHPFPHPVRCCLATPALQTLGG